MRHSLALLFSRRVTWSERIDGLLLLGIFVMGPITLLGWLLALALFYSGGIQLNGIVALLSFSAYAALGNSAAFFQIAAATRLDGSRQRVRLLPFLILGFGVSIFSVSWAAFTQLTSPITRSQFHWDKTERFRRVT